MRTNRRRSGSTATPTPTLLPWPSSRGEGAPVLVSTFGVASSRAARSEPSGDPSAAAQAPTPPSVTLPRGGGALRAIGEKFTANPATGVGEFTVAVPLSPARVGGTPALALSWQSAPSPTSSPCPTWTTWSGCGEPTGHRSPTTYPSRASLCAATGLALRDPVTVCRGPRGSRLIPVDEDLDRMTQEQLVVEVVKLRAAIRRHRDSS